MSATSSRNSVPLPACSNRPILRVMAPVKEPFSCAITRKIGRFEQAGSGTLFLDEVADMSLALQAKILRAVQEREIERVGGAETIPVDVRLIADRKSVV